MKEKSKEKKLKSSKYVVKYVNFFNSLKLTFSEFNEVFEFRNRGRQGSIMAFQQAMLTEESLRNVR